MVATVTREHGEMAGLMDAVARLAWAGGDPNNTDDPASRLCPLFEGHSHTAEFVVYRALDALPDRVQDRARPGRREDRAAEAARDRRAPAGRSGGGVPKVDACWPGSQLPGLPRAEWLVDPRWTAGEMCSREQQPGGRLRRGASRRNGDSTMVTCAGCGRTRGMLGRLTWHQCEVGRLTWHQCEECDSSFCPDCFGQLASSRARQTERAFPARGCSQCGSAIVTPVVVGGGGYIGPGW